MCPQRDKKEAVRTCQTASFLSLLCLMQGFGLSIRLFSCSQKQFQHLGCTLCYDGAGSEDCSCSCFVQEIVVLRRYNSSNHNHYVFSAEFLQFFNYLRNQGLVSCCQRTYTKYVNVVLNSLFCTFGRGLEQWSHIDIKSKVCISCCHNLCSSVVSVLSHLCFPLSLQTHRTTVVLS